MQVNYNLTLSNGSSNTIHQYQVYINKSSVVTAYWNFTYNISGLGSLMTLQFNLTCVESWSCGAWSTCSGSTQTRTCTEAIGCGTTNDKPAVSQSCTASSTSTGGSGTTGSAGGTSTSVLGQFEKKVWTSINAGETAVVSVANGEIGVTEVSFKVDQTVWGAWTKVEKKESLPSGTKTFGNKVYKYIEITKSSALKDSFIKNAEINFKVKKDWLNNNKVDKSRVVLSRYNADSWNELTTKITQEDESLVYYSAETPGFSYFAIVESATALEVPITEEQSTEVSSLTEAPVKEASAPEVPAKSQAWLWAILIIILVAIIAAIYFWPKKGGFFPFGKRYDP